MNKEQHYLLKLAEECNEVGKECSKAILFGLDDFEPNQDLSNKTRIENELSDLFSVMTGLVNMGYLDINNIISDSKRIRKVIKLDKYFKLSCELNRSEDI